MGEPKPWQFRKGYDPRRHKLSREECVDGFWGMVESITRRYPNMTAKNSTHKVKFALKYLIGKKRGEKR